MKLINKIAWIELQDGKILSTRSKGKDAYYIPGGKREAGESDQDTLLREIKEELSVAIQQDSIAYVGTFQAQAHGHATGTEVKMLCYTAQYTGNLAASAEIEEVVWLRYRDRDQVSPVDKLIFDWLFQQGLLT